MARGVLDVITIDRLPVCGDQGELGKNCNDRFGGGNGFKELG